MASPQSDPFGIRSGIATIDRYVSALAQSTLGLVCLGIGLYLLINQTQSGHALIASARGTVVRSSRVALLAAK